MVCVSSGMKRVGVLAVLAAWGCGAGMEELEDQELGQMEQPVLVGSQMNCPSGASGPCVVRNLPSLMQSSNQIDTSIHPDMLANGCYDTSMSVVIQTALENRTSGQALQGRTATYDSIVGGNNGAGVIASAEYKKLSRSYLWAQQHHPPVGQPVPGVQPYHFPEVIVDFLGTERRYPSGCNPFSYGSCQYNAIVANDFAGVGGRDFLCGEGADLGLPHDCATYHSHVNNTYIKDLMAKGMVVMIAFGRYQPVLDGSPTAIKFVRGGQHKVVFSGYQGGAFPLRVHDVGDANQYNVTVTNDMTKIASYAGVPVGNVTSFRFPNGKSRQTFIEYDPSVATEDGLVNFVDHVDYLSLSLPVDAPAKQVFSGTWGSGWSTLMPFQLNGAACQLAYNSTTGAVHFDQFFANSNGANTVWSATWGAGFTDFIPYYINGAPQFIAYNRNSGEVHFDAFPSNLQGPIIRAIRTWPAGLTSIVPFVLNGNNYLLMYNKNTGAASFRRINAAGDNTSGVWESTWSTGFTTFLPYTIDGHPHLVAYNAATGLVHYDRINDNLLGVTVKGTANLGANRKLSNIASRGPASFFSYTSGGALQTRRLAFNAADSGEVWSRSVLSNATITAPFTQAGKDYVLVYDGASGAVRSYEMSLF